MSWHEFGVWLKHLPASSESAYYRARYPESWHWSTEMDLLSLILHAVQGANWQRAGSKGEPPALIERPTDGEAPTTQPKANDSPAYSLGDIRGALAARKAAMNDKGGE